MPPPRPHWIICSPLDSITHGDPAFGNSLAISDGVSVASVEQTDGQVTVTLDGEPTARDTCETWRVAKQIETTARIATGADSAEVRPGGLHAESSIGAWATTAR